MYIPTFVPLALWQSKRPDTITHHSILRVYTFAFRARSLSARTQCTDVYSVYASFSSYIRTTT